MFKHFLTVLRADHARAEEAFGDRHALTILEQQLREGAAKLAQAKRAVALATAEAAQERATLERLVVRIETLEARTVAAIAGGEEALAVEGAETIASLEAERDASKKALAAFEREVSRLRDAVRRGESRLRALRRGMHVADARERTERLAASATFGPHADGLADAEATLERLADRQERDELAAAAFAQMDDSARAASLEHRMAEAGCGAPIGISAASVLDRLRERAGVAHVATPA